MDLKSVTKHLGTKDDAYFESIDKLNFSSQQQLVLQLWMYHLKGVVHRVVIDIWITNQRKKKHIMVCLLKKAFIIGYKIMHKGQFTIRNVQIDFLFCSFFRENIT